MSKSVAELEKEILKLKKEAQSRIKAIDMLMHSARAYEEEDGTWTIFNHDGDQLGNISLKELGVKKC